MINTLLTWRFIFTILVFYAHLGLTGNDSPVYKWIYPYLVTEAGMGIVFFFILSGFILSYGYQQKLLDRNESYFGFVSRRVARLFPLHLFTLLLIIPMSVYSQIKTGGGFAKWFLKLISNATLTQSWIPSSDFYFSLNGPSWCMSDEMFFYLLFPLIIYYGVKLPKKYRILLLVLFTSTILFLMTTTDRSVHHYLFYINPLTRAMEFMLGILLFQVFKSLKPGHLRFLNYTVLEVSAIVTLVAFLLLSSKVAPVFRFSV
ncbi:MAG TPA: acyltransferase, partial [Sphingobacteriaceae bacterium]